MSLLVRSAVPQRYPNDATPNPTQSLTLTYAGGTPTALVNVPFSIVTNTQFTALPNDTYQCNVPGYYICILKSASDSGDNATFDFLLNGVTQFEQVVSWTGTNQTTSTLTMVVKLLANDTISLYCANSAPIGTITLNVILFSYKSALK